MFFMILHGVDRGLHIVVELIRCQLQHRRNLFKETSKFSTIHRYNQIRILRERWLELNSNIRGFGQEV